MVEAGSSPDFGHYDLVDIFTLREAACLVAGVEPRTLRSGDRWPPSVQTVRDAMELGHIEAVQWLRESVHALKPGDLCEVVPPWDMADWPAGIRPMLPSTGARAAFTYACSARDYALLIDFDHREPMLRRADVVTWLQVKQYRHSRYFLTHPVSRLDGLLDKPLGTRERETLYRIIIGMAVEGYRYDPTASRGEAISEIVDDLQKAGVAVSDQAVRDHIKRAAQLLPKKPASV